MIKIFPQHLHYLLPFLPTNQKFQVERMQLFKLLLSPQKPKDWILLVELQPYPSSQHLFYRPWIFHIGCTYFFIAKLNFNNTDIIFPFLYSISYSNSFTDILYKVKIRSLYFRQGESNMFEFSISWCWKLKISSLKYNKLISLLDGLSLEPTKIIFFAANWLLL